MKNKLKTLVYKLDYFLDKYSPDWVLEQAVAKIQTSRKLQLLFTIIKVFNISASTFLAILFILSFFIS